MTPHDLEEGLPRQGALELEQRVVVIDMDRDSFAVCACLWADARRGMPVFFHEVLLREDSCAYPQAYQKAQRPFNPSRTHGAPEGIRLTRDSLVSVVYAEELNSAKSS